MNKKKKQIKKVPTLVNFILDKSGSMGSVYDATISGFNEYLNTLKKDGNNYNFSLTLFDTEVKTVHVNKPIKQVDKLDKESYTADGCTALYDAVCKTVNEVKKTVTKGTKVLTVIMTDGEENSSKEYSEKELKKLITELEATKMWSFVFLGANQDAWANAGQWGFTSANVSNFNSTSKGINTVFAMMATNTASAMRGSDFSGDSAKFFSAKDKDTLEKTK